MSKRFLCATALSLNYLESAVMAETSFHSFIFLDVINECLSVLCHWLLGCCEYNVVNNDFDDDDVNVDDDGNDDDDEDPLSTHLTIQPSRAYQINLLIVLCIMASCSTKMEINRMS